MTRLTIADLEIERPAEPFEIEIDSIVFKFVGPKEMLLSDVVAMEALPPVEQIRALIADDKFDEFSHRIKANQFEVVMKKYASHYGLGSLGEGSASSRSLNGTARRSKRISRSGA